MTELGILSCMRLEVHENRETRAIVDEQMRGAVRHYCDTYDKVTMPNSETWEDDWLTSLDCEVSVRHCHRTLVVDLQDAVHAA